MSIIPLNWAISFYSIWLFFNFYYLWGNLFAVRIEKLPLLKLKLWTLAGRIEPITYRHHWANDSDLRCFFFFFAFFIHLFLFDLLNSFGMMRMKQYFNFQHLDWEGWDIISCDAFNLLLNHIFFCSFILFSLMVFIFIWRPSSCDEYINKS